MDCSYSIKINGKEVTLVTDVPIDEIRDINDLEKLLRTQPKKVLESLIEQLQSVNSVEDIKLDDINENSVGLYSPADLINSISSGIGKDKRS